MAESGYGMHSYDGAKSHKGHWAIPVKEFVGSIEITEDFNHETIKNLDLLSLSEAAADYPNVKKAKLGMAVNESRR